MGIEDNAGEDSQEEQINTTQIKLNLSSDLKMLSSVTPGTLKHFQEQINSIASNGYTVNLKQRNALIPLNEHPKLEMAIDRVIGDSTICTKYGLSTDLLAPTDWKDMPHATFFPFFISVLSSSQGKSASTDETARGQEIYDTFLTAIKTFNPKGESGEVEALFNSAYSHMTRLKFLDPSSAAYEIFTQQRTEELWRQFKKRLANGADMLNFTRTWAHALNTNPEYEKVNSECGWRGFSRIVHCTFNEWAEKFAAND